MSRVKHQIEEKNPEQFRSQPEPRLDARDVDSEMEFEKRYQRDMEAGVEFPVQSENVAAQAIRSAYLDEGPKYFKPLTMNDRLLIDTLTTRYESVEAPFIAIDKGDYIELRHSETIRRVTSYDTKAVKGEEAGLLRVSANG